MTNLQLLKFINAYIDYCAFAGYIMGCLTYKKYPNLRPFTWLLLLTLINNQLLSYSGFYFKVNRPLFHIFNPLQLLLLGWFFYINFEQGWHKKSIPIILIFAMLFTIVNTAFFQDFSTYPNNFIILETLLLMVWATILFIEKLDLPPKVNIFKDPIFIITVGILCFNIFSFIFFLLTNYFSRNDIYQFSSIYKILYFANFVYYGTAVIAFIYSFRKANQIENARC